MASRVKKLRGKGLRQTASELRKLPRRVAIDVAQLSASGITTEAGTTYDSGQNAYGLPRPLGANGNVLDLVVTGAARSFMRFVSDGGTVIRAVLPKPYIKYLIGKYLVLPIGQMPIPQRWKAVFERNTKAAIDEVVRKL